MMTVMMAFMPDVPMRIYDNSVLRTVPITDVPVMPVTMKIAGMMYSDAGYWNNYINPAPNSPKPDSAPTA